MLYDESMKPPTFDIERSLSNSYRNIVGVDEAGRGPLAGPVVAAAVRYRNHSFEIPDSEREAFRYIRDSKTLSERLREGAFARILEYFDVATGVVDAEIIDRVNILQATFLAMREAVGKLFGDGVGDDTLVLVDGNQEIPSVRFSQQTVVKGDAISFSVAAASIVAKVTRDRILSAIDRDYPHFGFSRHKGYGTVAHMEAIRRYGILPIHRRSFAPVGRAMGTFAKKKES